jgi:hypothetical protein
MKRLALISLAALMVGCGSSGDGDGRIGTGGTDLVGVDLESHCRAWCEPETGCDGGQGTPLQCLDSCLADAERDPCFSHVVTYQQCVLDMECSDPFEDCEAPGGLPFSGDGLFSCDPFDNAYARCTCEEIVQEPPPPLPLTFICASDNPQVGTLLSCPNGAMIDFCVNQSANTCYYSVGGSQFSCGSCTDQSGLQGCAQAAVESCF